jgi:hypothetical protein
MLDALGIAGDIIQGATALAGLMIVFIGNAVSGYSSYLLAHGLLLLQQRASIGSELLLQGALPSKFC